MQDAGCRMHVASAVAIAASQLPQTTATPAAASTTNSSDTSTKWHCCCCRVSCNYYLPINNLACQLVVFTPAQESTSVMAHTYLHLPTLPCKCSWHADQCCRFLELRMDMLLVERMNAGIISVLKNSRLASGFSGLFQTDVTFIYT